MGVFRFQLRAGGVKRVAEGNEVRGPKGQERGQGSWGHQLGGLNCKLPQWGAAKRFYHTFEVLRKASPDTSVLLLRLKIGSHMNALVCCRKLLTLDPSHYLIQFSIVQASAPFPVDFARVTCKICYTQFHLTRLEKIDLGLSRLRTTWTIHLLFLLLQWS